MLDVRSKKMEIGKIEISKKPLTPLSKIVVFVALPLCVVSLVLLLYLERFLFAMLAAGLTVCSLGCSLIVAGSLTGGLVTRDENPVTFWTQVVATLLFGLGLSTLAVYLLIVQS
jgi:uncharacterized membrane protein